jgi:hypothetical protein
MTYSAPIRVVAVLSTVFSAIFLLYYLGRNFAVPEWGQSSIIALIILWVAKCFGIGYAPSYKVGLVIAVLLGLYATFLAFVLPSANAYFRGWILMLTATPLLFYYKRKGGV